MSLMRLAVGCLMLYAALMAFCGFGVRSLPESTQASVGSYLWLFGPPANLVHGAHYWFPFIVGTAVVAGCFFGVVRSRSRNVKGACGVGLLMAWSLFGFIAYAPGG